MKIGWILFACLQSLWSIEAGLISFRYLANLDLFWSFMFCVAISAADLAIYFYLAEKLRQSLENFPRFKEWLNKENFFNSRVAWCRHWGRLGLFLSAAVPHLLFAGIATQKIFRFKHGFSILLCGTIIKAATVSGCLKIFEHLIG